MDESSTWTAFFIIKTFMLLAELLSAAVMVAAPWGFFSALLLPLLAGDAQSLEVARASAQGLGGIGGGHRRSLKVMRLFQG